MQVVYERCCGLDVHKQTVVASVVTADGKVTRTFKTVTESLLALADWLHEQGCTHVAMESTGVYWKPVYNILEPEGFTLLVVNAAHMKAVPGRKTDVKDAEWIADLLRHGLLKASFIPDRPQRELAELVRLRRNLVEDRARASNRVHNVLEGANIKLGSVITTLFGVSGRRMLDALAAGETDPAVLAGHGDARLRATPTELRAALRGAMGAQQQLQLQILLRQIDFLTEQMTELDSAIATQLAPVDDAITRLETIPGVGRRTAEELVAVIGTDMSRFPTHRHLASWAKLCPGLKESGGKRQSSTIGQGNTMVRRALVEAAWAASHTKRTYLSALYHRIAARRGRKRALIAVAHSILVIAYHILKDGTTYRDLGHDYFDQRDKDQVIRKAKQRIEQLGKKVTIEDVA